MKFFKKKDKKKKAKSDKIIIRNGENDIRVYPKKTLLVEGLTQEK